MTDLPSTITSVATLVAAVGAFVVAVFGAWKSNAGREESIRAKQAAVDAKATAEQVALAAKEAAEDSKREIVATQKGVFEVGKALDGRLQELLRATQQLAREQGRAEGIVEGRRAERRDAAAGRPDVIDKDEPPGEDKP